MTMPFGVHKGLPLNDLPNAYLEWLAGIDLRPSLRRGVDAELSRRCGRGPDENSASSGLRRLGPDDLGLARELLQSGYRAMAKKHHPDFGGDAVVMRQLIDVANKLRGWLEVVA